MLFSTIQIVVLIADHLAIKKISLTWIPEDSASQIPNADLINKFYFVLQASTFYAITLREELA